MNIITELTELKNANLISLLDLQFSKFIKSKLPIDEDEHANNLAILTSAICSSELSKGHCCLSIQKLLNHPFLKRVKSPLPTPEKWRRSLECSKLFSTDGSPSMFAISNDSVYMYNVYVHETKVAQKINAMTSDTRSLLGQSSIVDSSIIETLNTLFPRSYNHLFSALSKIDTQSDMSCFETVIDALNVVDSRSLDIESIANICRSSTDPSDLFELDKVIPNNCCCDYQKIAALTALQKRFSVISGGAGTGKTSTVVKFLALSVISELTASNKTLKIDLAAPTGKAASRLTESITKAIDEIDVSNEVKSLIPRSATTLHKLLGYSYTSTKLKYNEENKLNTDILVIDESSMVDLSQLYNCLSALREDAKIVLLGDENQLLSVEAGSILADICSFDGISQKQRAVIESYADCMIIDYSHHDTDNNPQKVVSDSICMLKKSYRFNSKSGIGLLAAAVNSGFSTLAIDLIENGIYRDINLYDVSADSFSLLIKTASDYYGNYIDLIRANAPPKEILDAFNKVRVLCAVKDGVFGIHNINNNIEMELISRGLIPERKNLWYNAKPIMITKNDSTTKLSNGDVGVAIFDKNTNNIFVHIEMSDGTIKKFPPNRIPAHETSFAMTIHKSQGSEFDYAFTILPTKSSPLLTRELVYTAITRAKKKYTIFSPKEIFEKSIKTRTIRNSNLHKLLM